MKEPRPTPRAPMRRHLSDSNISGRVEDLDERVLPKNHDESLIKAVDIYPYINPKALNRMPERMRGILFLVHKRVIKIILEKICKEYPEDIINFDTFREDHQRLTYRSIGAGDNIKTCIYSTKSFASISELQKEAQKQAREAFHFADDEFTNRAFENNFPIGEHESPKNIRAIQTFNVMLPDQLKTLICFEFESNEQNTFFKRLIEKCKNSINLLKGRKINNRTYLYIKDEDYPVFFRLYEEMKAAEELYNSLKKIFGRREILDRKIPIKTHPIPDGMYALELKNENVEGEKEVLIVANALERESMINKVIAHAIKERNTTVLDILRTRQMTLVLLRKEDLQVFRGTWNLLQKREADKTKKRRRSRSSEKSDSGRHELSTVY
jgi:hypothetical protein